MHVDRERKFLFIHIPKTAGQSVLSALGLPKMHSKPHPMETYTEDTEPLFRFTFVRNPFDRAVSAYYYSKKMAEDGKLKGHPVRQAILDYGCDTFDHFVRAVLTESVANRNMHFRPQWRWLAGGWPSYIGRVETLAEDMDHISRIIGPVGDVPNLNRSSGRRLDFRDEYTDVSYDIVTQVYADDFKALGYSFADSAFPLQSFESVASPAVS